MAGRSDVREPRVCWRCEHWFCSTTGYNYCYTCYSDIFEKYTRRKTEGEGQGYHKVHPLRLWMRFFKHEPQHPYFKWKRDHTRHNPLVGWPAGMPEGLDFIEAMRRSAEGGGQRTKYRFTNPQWKVRLPKGPGTKETIALWNSMQL